MKKLISLFQRSSTDDAPAAAPIDWEAKFKLAATDLAAQAEEIAGLKDTVARTMGDSQRLIWRDDVEGICRSPDMCFEYGDHARCGPCAIDQARACGVVTIEGLPNLPEVTRLRRELESLRPDALAMRRKRQMDRDRRSGKAVKS